MSKQSLSCKFPQLSQNSNTRGNFSIFLSGSSSNEFAGGDMPRSITVDTFLPQILQDKF